MPAHGPSYPSRNNPSSLLSAHSHHTPEKRMQETRQTCIRRVCSAFPPANKRPCTAKVALGCSAKLDFRAHTDMEYCNIVAHGGQIDDSMTAHFRRLYREINTAIDRTMILHVTARTPCASLACRRRMSSTEYNKAISHPALDTFVSRY